MVWVRVWVRVRVWVKVRVWVWVRVQDRQFPPQKDPGALPAH